MRSMGVSSSYKLQFLPLRETPEEVREIAREKVHKQNNNRISNHPTERKFIYRHPSIIDMFAFRFQGRTDFIIELGVA